MKLKDIANYVTETYDWNSFDLRTYVTTDSLVANKAGREIASLRPAKSGRLIKFKKNDILVSNIRPYLKKIWFANESGSCSNDVLVFRANPGVPPSFLYSCLLQDQFFNYVMRGTKGSKMPRGDRRQIMEFVIQAPLSAANEIGSTIFNLQKKFDLLHEINRNLEAMARQLYDYWFVQFDFPDENGRPYKSSGGRMVWNEKLKRDIPEQWEVINLFDAIDVQYGFPFSTELLVDDVTNTPVVRIRDILNGTVSAYSTEETDSKYRLSRGDVLIGMDGNFHMNLWCDNQAYLNQRSVRFRQIGGSPISALQVMFEVAPYIKAKEQNAKGSTVGHLSDKDLRGLWILKPFTHLHFSPEKTLNQIADLIVENRIEVSNLTTQRDELLPLLMNGQASVIPTEVNCDLFKT
ncbi:restriction endonuclease subunit S [uncultured Parasutterella sp.]|uniref:restriction endonuclease subunit S n=2 Tax=uncultured Parasutterella sp. TaxID=1263098 RepID=UPI002711F2F3|nr:restriction endonuclease subunit S [uncultured Parasutterella sp.]